MNSSLLPIHVRIVSRTPGRLRLRVDSESCQPEEINKIADCLKDCLEVCRVRTNIHTGSITVFYPEERTNFNNIRLFLQNLGITLGEIAPKTIAKGPSEAAAEVIGNFSLINQRVKRATDNAIDLRFLVPLGFSFLAVRQLFVRGLLLENIPWYVLAWYSFDSFIKLNPTRSIKAERGGVVKD